jgi:hypothetical protein
MWCKAQGFSELELTEKNNAAKPQASAKISRVPPFSIDRID